jgi:hypothetical protein
VILAASGGALSLCFTVGFIACGSSDHPGSAGSSSGVVGGDGSTVDVEAAAPIEAAAPPPGGYDGGVGLGLADIADTPCGVRGGSLAVVIPGTPGTPADDAGADAGDDGGAEAGAGVPFASLRNLHALGTRRVAEAIDQPSFVLFDADGKNAKVVPTTLDQGTTAVLGQEALYAGFRDASGVQVNVQPYDATGAPAGAEVNLAGEDPEALAATVDSTAAFFVWGNRTRGTLQARAFGAGAADGMLPYDFARGLDVSTVSIALAPVKDGLFASAFSVGGNGTFVTAFGRGSRTARSGDPFELFSGEVPRTVVGMARTPSGFAILLTVQDSSKPYAMLVLTDVAGRRTSAGLKLLGTIEGSAIVTNGSELGVLAHRRENGKVAVEFRAFDFAGAPLAPWVCLDAPADDTALGGGLVADGAGYSAIFRAADGSASLARFDHFGTGALP